MMHILENFVSLINIYCFSFISLFYVMSTKKISVQNILQEESLFASNSAFIEQMYQRYLKNPNTVDISWQNFFKNHDSSSPIETFPLQEKDSNNNTKVQETNLSLEFLYLKVKNLVKKYREKGHFLSKLDPLNLERNWSKEELNLELKKFDIQISDLEQIIDPRKLFYTKSTSLKLGDLIHKLEKIYSSKIALECSYINDEEKQNWLYQEFEMREHNFTLSIDEKKEILKNLTEVNDFEDYLHKKFVGGKRFSIEGCDSFIICLKRILEVSSSYEVDNFTFSLAHRGRLSSLVHILEKQPRVLFSEFISKNPPFIESGLAGDVKYHMGYSCYKTVKNKRLFLHMISNPSHLEATNSITCGLVRCKQDQEANNRSIGIIVHGDSAFSGQGVAAENLLMSTLPQYEVRGAIHIVINNQIGFTTTKNEISNSRYCTDVAKIANLPVIHINTDDVESVVFAAELASKYRQKFASDIVIDIVGYRRHGHNEGDEPRFTQNYMYQIIDKKERAHILYNKKLLLEKAITDDYLKKIQESFKQKLDLEFSKKEQKISLKEILGSPFNAAVKYIDEKSTTEIATGIEKKILDTVAQKLLNIDKNFNLNPKLKLLFQKRLENFLTGRLDWPLAEQLSLAVLLKNGFNIRFSGQDSQRGTFSQRHAVLHDQILETHPTYIPLNNISKDQGKFRIYNSNLSEYGALGFEYGYSLSDQTKNLVIWEAQYGDFANGAQIIFDQFISSAEQKWLIQSNIIVLLPHGLEGQGPEHSSARIERFLQLSAQQNLQVIYPTTPANIFHALQRQAKNNIRKPLIIFSPKSLLRNKLAISNIAEIEQGTNFLPIIDQTTPQKKNSISKILFCSGKIFFDLLQKKDLSKSNHVSIIRIEQLYPFKQNMLSNILEGYNKNVKLAWVQEEPMNMGVWNFIKDKFILVLKNLSFRQKLEYIGRDEAASPAIGYMNIHSIEQEKILKNAFD